MPKDLSKFGPLATADGKLSAEGLRTLNRWRVEYPEAARLLELAFRSLGRPKNAKRHDKRAILALVRAGVPDAEITQATGCPPNMPGKLRRGVLGIWKGWSGVELAALRRKSHEPKEIAASIPGRTLRAVETRMRRMGLLRTRAEWALKCMRDREIVEMLHADKVPAKKISEVIESSESNVRRIIRKLLAARPEKGQ